MSNLSSPYSGPPILVPPKVCIQRVPVPWPVKVPVHIRVPYKVTEKVEVKVPFPVKVRDPYPVRVPFPVPYPVQQPPKEDKPTTPCPPPIIQPPPTIIHNYVPEPEPQIFLRPQPYESKPQPKYRKTQPKYEHYDDPHPELGYEEMEEGDLRPLSKDEYSIKPGRAKRPSYGFQTGLGYPSTSLIGMTPGIFGSRMPYEMPSMMNGMVDPRCLFPGMALTGTPVQGYGSILPQIAPSSSNVYLPTGIQSYLPSSSLPFSSGRQPLHTTITAGMPSTQQLNGKDCVKICN